MSKALALKVSLYTLGCLYVGSTKVSFAQVTPDDTVNTQVDSSDSVVEITGGETRDSNLFHSFQDFSVPSNNEAFFNNAESIDNIFSRVTGDNISNINGLIRANGTASLFLINPNGIVFGEGARLELGGSFYGSTASSILFEDGEFSAVDNLEQPILTVNAPIGLGFRDEPGNIVNRSVFDNVGLQVASGKTLGLLGGDVSLEGGLITALGGRIELGGLTETGIVGIGEGLSFPNNIAKANVFLSNNAAINTQVSERGQGENAGNVSITANTLELQGSNVSVNNRKPDSEGAGNSGNIKIQAEESVLLNGGVLSATMFAGSTGNVGKIEINSPQVSLTDNAVISVSNSGIGDIGNIEINADTLAVDNFSLITASSRPNSDIQPSDTGGSGSVTIDSERVTLSRGGIIDVTTANQIDGGQININSQILEILTGGVLQTATEGSGKAGKVNLTIGDRLIIDGTNPPVRPEEFNFTDPIVNNLQGRTGIITEAVESATGNAGEISITSKALELSNDAQLITQNRGTGSNAGNIDLDITDSLIISNGADFNTQIGNDATGTAGKIEITTNTLEILNQELFNGSNSGYRTSILAENKGEGISGDIDIVADESVFLKNSIISSTITENASGTSGNISINSPQVSLTDNSVVSVSTAGTGEGGDINIDSETISIDNYSLIAASSRTGSSRGSGSITLNSDRVTLSNGGVINATTASNAQGGQIEINSQILEIFSGGVIQTATDANGRAGNIDLNISELTILDGRNAPARPPEFDFAEEILNNLLQKTGIFAGTSGNAPSTGGSININSNFIVAFPNGNSDIIASSLQGKGGEINITTESLFGIEERPENIFTNDIDASSGVGLDGTVNINIYNVNPIQGAVELTTNPIESEQTIVEACNANREAVARSTLTVRGRGGVLPAPDLPQDSFNISSSYESNSLSAIPEQIETGLGKIQPARGIKVTKKGIVLTAYRTNSSGDRLSEVRPNCS